MKNKVALSTKNIIGLWAIFAILCSFWLILLITSPAGLRVADALLLIAACSFIPIIGTFFVYVTIDDSTLTVPFALFFRRSIPIPRITALNLQSGGLGLIKGVQVEYVDSDGMARTAILPSITTFGPKKTSQMIAALLK